MRVLAAILYFLFILFLVLRTYRRLSVEQRQELKQPSVVMMLVLLLSGFVLWQIGFIMLHQWLMHSGAVIALFAPFISCVIGWRQGKIKGRIVVMYMLLACVGIGAYILIMNML